MNKKLKGSVLTLLALSQVTGVAIQPVLTVHAEEYTLTADATERLNSVKDAVSKMEANPNKDTIKAAMDSFLNIYTDAKRDVNDEKNTEGDMALHQNGHADTQFKKILGALNKQGQSVHNDLTLHFFNQMGLRYGNDDIMYFEDHLTDLIDNTKNEAMHERLMIGAGQLNHLLFFEKDQLTPDSKGNMFHVVNGDIKLINPVPMEVSEEDTKPMPVGELDVDLSLVTKEPEATEADEVPMDDTWEDIFYEMVDGKPTKIVITYTRINGEVQSVERRFVVSYSEMFGGTEEDWKLINDGEAVAEGAGDLSLEEDEVQEDEVSNNTLHYTVTKGTDDVYYYDTGIRVDTKGNASYQQVKDVLYQLALRAEGYLAEDEGKFLIVVEGKPVLIREKKDEYNKEEIEEMFKSFSKVDMRIMPTRIGTTASLEEQLVSGTAQTVQINGEDADLKHHPLVENGQVLLSIEELAGLLELDYEVDDTKHIVSKDEKEIVYEENVKAVTVDGTVKELTTPSVKNEDDALMVDISELLDLFDVQMVWDEENSTILLETK